jgi:hypothetical protein
MFIFFDLGRSRALVNSNIHMVTSSRTKATKRVQFLTRRLYHADLPYYIVIFCQHIVIIFQTFSDWQSKQYFNLSRKNKFSKGVCNSLIPSNFSA